MAQAIRITGATSGIGRATAGRFAAEDRRAAVTGRREDPLRVCKKP
jgi:NADP-dependent 3-hydroxy acid dehydrogenase YdfG